MLKPVGVCMGLLGAQRLHGVLVEVRRKSIHVIPGFLAIPFIVWLGRPIALAVSAFFLALYGLNELSLRYGLGWRVPIAYHTYLLMARREELRERTFIGTVYFWGVTTAAIALLPPEPAAAAVMVSSLGDAAAAIVGRALSNPRNPLNRRKSVAGSLAMLCTSAISCMATGFPLYSSLAIAAVATLVEAATRRSLDDEFTVPVAAALATYLAYVLGF